MAKNKISKQAKTLWAKKRTTEDGGMWLPLVVHLTDTSNISKMLFNQWLSPEQRVILTSHYDEEDIRQLVMFIGFVHDIGKATPAFQLKGSYDRNYSLDQELIENLVQSGFRELDSTHLSSPNRSPHAKAGEAILEDLGVPSAIAAIVGGHHGRPLSHAPWEDIQAYTTNYQQSEHDNKIRQNWREVQKELLDYGLANSHFDSVDQLPMLTEPQAIIVEGLLIMADWLASSEYLDNDPAQPLFPLISLCQGVDDINVTARYQSAWTSWQFNDEWVPDRVECKQDPYKSRWGFHARPVQMGVTQAIEDATDPGLVILEAPMGVGKTETSLLAVEQLAEKGQETGLFFGLPTQATANAMFDRVDSWLTWLSERQSASFSIQLMHSKAAFNPSYQRIPNAKDVDGEDPVVINRWFSGKKTILDEFSIGTIDNLLQLALKQKHLALKHLGLSKKVVVIDEVHAYDAYMNQYLYRVLEWLGTYHVPVVVLSATLPKDKRNQLLASYFYGKFGKRMTKAADLSQVSEKWQNNTAYPLISILDGHALKQVSNFAGNSDQAPLEVGVSTLNSDEQTLVQTVLSLVDHGGVAGVIVNTIQRAQKLAALFSPNVPILVLHSAFVASDRSVLETKLQALIGKDGERPPKLVVIGTQVLEQSLDIDFDLLVSDIAPMDLLLQRAGRLHRHHLPARPARLMNPKLIVAGIDAPYEYEAGSVAVYGQYLLMKTEAAMLKTLHMPSDISPLVQRVYDFSEDPSLPGIEDAKARFEELIELEKQKAAVFQIDPPTNKVNKTIHGWLDNDLPGLDRDEVRAEAAVRDIDESVEIILLQRREDGFFLLNGLPVQSAQLDQQAKLIAQQTIRLPRVFSFGIDQTIAELEKKTLHLGLDWQDNVWLKGALVLALDHEMNATLRGYTIHYSSELGLSYRKGDKNASKTV